MAVTTNDAWDAFCEAVSRLHIGISKSQAININSSSLRQQSKDLAQDYFRQTRPALKALNISAVYVSHLDEMLQSLLRLSSGKNNKRAYLSLLKPISEIATAVRVAIELQHSELAFRILSSQSNALSDIEAGIYDTLLKIIPTAALSYKQAITDLADKSRISYRGAANELREALRETIDYFAPDDIVSCQPNFKFEKDKTKPTMKQKVRFILKARELTNNAMQAPEEAVKIVEERIASLTRATYERSSISTHVASERSEVIQMKNYVNAVLAESLVLQSWLNRLIIMIKNARKRPLTGALIFDPFFELDVKMDRLPFPSLLLPSRQ